MNRTSHRNHRPRRRRRGAALYMAVLSTALIVSLLALAGLTVVRIERRQVADAANLLVARANARSAIELAVQRLSDSTDWRTTLTHGAETTPVSLGVTGGGTCSWIVRDSDGDLALPDTELRIIGIGRADDTIQVASIEIDLSVSGLLRSYESDVGSAASDFVENRKWWCQYFQPNLPPSACGWVITSVEFHCAKDENGLFDVVLYQPDGTNMPSDTVVDSATFDSSGLGESRAWREFALTGDYLIDPAEGICLALTTSEEELLEINYMSGGVSEADSALIFGNPGWSSYDVDKALLYRVHGKYYQDYGDVKPVTGTWLWEAAP